MVGLSRVFAKQFEDFVVLQFDITPNLNESNTRANGEIITSHLTKEDGVVLLPVNTRGNSFIVLYYRGFWDSFRTDSHPSNHFIILVSGMVLIDHYFDLLNYGCQNSTYYFCLKLDGMWALSLNSSVYNYKFPLPNH